MSNINILIIEDEALIAHDIGRRIKKLGYEVAGIKVDSQDALNFLELNSPDLILCDIQIEGPIDGIELATHIRKEKKIPLIFVTAYSDRATLERAKDAMPYGYIVKPFNNRDLFSTIEMALNKYSSELNQLMITKDRIDSLCCNSLSDREYEILEDIINGKNNSKIAENRFISINTVKFHIKNIFEKMDVKNRVETLHKIIDLLTKQTD